jgi:signal transduction histidine kinase
LKEQIDARDKAHAELAEAQQRLIDLSRLSGMAEVATGVIHNVGNVLNSVMVGATLVLERLRQSRVGNLVRTAELLEQHQADLDGYLRTDPAGQRLVPYFGKLARHLAEEREELVGELHGLSRHVSHIKEIVAEQQTYARASGLTETVACRLLFEDALRMTHAALDRHRIEVRREFEDLPPITTDRHKVLQILLNLVRNAKDSLKESREAGRTIVVGLRHAEPGRLRFEVADNGAGIAAEDMTRIFSHGFTTKKDGHGYGLHSGALAARQMGGSLTVQSDGPGRGAVFALELPVEAPADAGPEETG